MKWTPPKTFCVSVLACTAFIYFMFNTAFGFTYFARSHDGYYGMLADSFLHEQLSIRKKVDPGLLKLKIPYDPKETGKYHELNDATLYNGKYYFYWGPIPAFVRILLLDNLVQNFYSFLYILGCAVFSLLILVHLKKKYFTSVGHRWLLVLFSYIAFNGVVMYMLGAVGIYYEAIAAGQFFMLAGLYTYLVSLTMEKHTRKHLWYLLGTGILLGLCVGSRISYFSVILFLIGYETYTQRAKLRFNTLAVLVLPVLIVMGILALYNYARFGNIFEFGLKTQLLGPQPVVFTPLASVQNIPNNIKNYFFSIPSHTLFPPYITMNPLRYSLYERVNASVFILSPLILLAFFPVTLKPAVRKLFIFLAIFTGIIVFNMLYLMPYSPIRYFFDIIFCLNIVAAIKAMALLEQYKTTLAGRIIEVCLTGALVIVFYYAWAFWLYAIMEYHFPAYFDYNKKVFLDHDKDRRYIDPQFNTDQFPDEVLINGEMHEAGSPQ